MSPPGRNDKRAPTASQRVVPKITIAQLMRGNRELILQHGLEEYRLRITSKGKLILTK